MSQALVIVETPKRAFSWLETFPPDLWACIVCYLSGEQLGRLMMTGAAYLWERLKSPKVVTSIKLGGDFMVFQSLPRFLNDFCSLEELLIDSPCRGWNSELSLKIDSIPTRVRKLKMHGQWDHVIFSSMFEVDGVTLKLNEHLPHLKTLDLRALCFRSYSWMIHAPPSLTRLSLQCWSGDAELPSSLVHFQADDVSVQAPSMESVSKLPPSLESFVVRDYFSGVDLIVPLLPPLLRTLGIGCDLRWARLTPRHLLEQLPKVLTCLVLNVSEFEENPELVCHLPSTLVKLRLTGIALPCSSWLLLPQNLTELSLQAPKPLATEVSKRVDHHEIRHHVEDREVHADDLELHVDAQIDIEEVQRRQVPSLPFDTLPRSIKKLELWYCGETHFCGSPANLKTSSYFPPGLTWLKISNLQLSPETAKLLPSSLTYLEIGNLCERVCQHLPNSLKTLICRTTLLSPNLISFLPKSLTLLCLFAPQASAPWFDYRTGKSMDSIAQLLEHSAHDKFLSNQDIALPSTLTDISLRLADTNEYGGSFLFLLPLRNLLRLSLGNCKDFSDSSIPLLCHQLTTLALPSSSNVSGKSFEYLPRGLTHLDLNRSECIFDSDIQHLPRKLKLAYLSHAIHLTDKCLLDLPPRLERLSLRYNTQIPSSTLPNFPHSLRSCQQQLSVDLNDWYISAGEAVRRERPASSVRLG